MKKKVSDNQLILVVVIAVIISSFSLLLSLAKLNLTGAYTEEGYVNITVGTVVEITFLVDTVNFTATKAGVSKNTYNVADLESYDPMWSVWTGSYGLVLINDGTNFINVTIREDENLFDSNNFNSQEHFNYNITMNDQSYTTAYGGKGSCSTCYENGLPCVEGWRAIPRSPTTEVAICYLNYSGEPACPRIPTGRCYRPDITMIELKIKVPDDEEAGEKLGSLNFVAVSVGTG